MTTTRKPKLARIADLIQEGDTVYKVISRIGTNHGAAGYMPASVMRDCRPATPRLVLAASAKLVGYGGSMVHATITGESAGCDAATAASLASVIQHAR